MSHNIYDKLWKVFFIISTSSISFIYSEVNTCVRTSTTGCIYSNSYDLATQFVCGSMQAGNTPPIYDLATQGCCNMGIVYSKELEFCCNNQIYPLGAGQCVRWFRADVEKYPDCYDCTNNPGRALSYKDLMLGNEEVSSIDQTEEMSQEFEEKFIPNPNYLRTNTERVPPSPIKTSSNTGLLTPESASNINVPPPSPVPQSSERRLATWPTSEPFDTIAAGPSPTACTVLDDKVGCYNTYQYNYVTHYPCYGWLLTWSVWGCCDGTPYRHQSQTCCYLDGVYVVKNANTWCTCQSYECAPSAAPTKVLKSKSPTLTPTKRPSSSPTITFAPTGVPSSSSPTITFSPTNLVALSAKSDDDQVFNPDYIYGAAAFLFVGLGGLMYLQSRASKLISERHHIVSQIDEAT
jgi:hypothetical protein